MKKILLSILSVSLIITIAVTIAAVVRYRQGRGPESNPELKADLRPEASCRLGQTVFAETELELPWHRYPESLEIKLPDGLQQRGSAKFAKHGYSWGKTDWRVTLPIQSFKPGNYDLGKAILVLNRPRPGEISELIIDIPPLSVNPTKLDVNANPELAGIMDYDWRDYLRKILSLPFYLLIPIAIVIIIIGLAATFIILRFARRRLAPKPAPPPWEQSLAELASLHEAFSQHKHPPETILGKLTDIVRGYIEKRFRIHAPRQTSPEFLADIKDPGSPLLPEQRQFLIEFISAADLVKFARLPADSKLLETTFSKAEELVRNTIPNENAQADSGGGRK